MRSFPCVFPCGRGNSEPPDAADAFDTFPEAQTALKKPDGHALYISREALYAGPDISTVEAALASGREAARTILQQERN
jgi:NAD(P)H-hydrate repair Nnr-like enzyme with NAD(P)H-hydrate dehydratase domain